MSDKEWEQLNHNYHNSYQHTGANPDDPHWKARTFRQARAITGMNNLGLIGPGQWVDYGAGDGLLSTMVSKKGLYLANYDKYMHHADYLSDEDFNETLFPLITCTCVFEHVRERADLDCIIDALYDDGILALHTMVVEDVPKDPNWNYYLQVHCSFYTNRSMQILFDDWGFKSSFYHVPSRMWFCFKGDVPFKEGFMDYWK